MEPELLTTGTAPTIEFPEETGGAAVPDAPVTDTPVSDAPAEASEGVSQETEAPRPPRFRRLQAFLLCRENAARAVFVIGPWLTYLMVEYLNNNDPFHSLTTEQVALNLMWYYLIFWLFRLVLGRKGLAAWTASAACFLFALANHYVLTFRGRIIFPCDLFSIGTAANVAGNFDYTPDKNVWIAAGILAGYWVLLLLGHLVFHPKGRQKLRLPAAIASWAAIAVYLYVFFCTPLLPTIGIYAQQWKTQANGFLLNFMTALRYSFVSAPEDYSAERAQELANEIDQHPAVSSGLELPENLVVIMNESFADMAAAFPNLELTEDPLPFFHSLTENTVKGTMISPVTGGGTANVEFEFLTGDSLAFLPSSTVAYQLYCYDGMPSLVSQLKKLDYHAIAFHPYLSSGWNRTSVYPWMGFDRQFYQEDVENPRLIRKYVSDSSDYEQLYRWTDETEGPAFLFNVTMQNHSGYAQGWNNLDRSVEAAAPDGASSSAVAQYLSLAKESDNAIRELIEHYSASDERTMVVFFGDHQPPLGSDFYKAVYGKNLDDRTTEEVFQEYAVPFFIWANYDIPEAEDLTISANYLGTLTAYLAGLELTGYQKLHWEMMSQLPVATTIGFMLPDGTVTDREDDLPEEARTLYEAYRILAYNHLFDEDSHPDGFYD